MIHGFILATIEGIQMRIHYCADGEHDLQFLHAELLVADVGEWLTLPDDDYRSKWAEVYFDGHIEDAVLDAIERTLHAIDVSIGPRNRDRALAPLCPLCKGSGQAIEIDAFLADGRLINPREAVCMACDGVGRAWPDEDDDADQG